MSLRFRIGVIAALCFLHADVPAAAAGDSGRCSIIPFAHTRDPRATLLLGVALSDTMPAGPGSVLSAAPASGDRGVPREIYGQVIQIEKFEGAGSAALAGLAQKSVLRALVVPWGYGADCDTVAWSGSARWVPVGDPAVFAVRMRAETEWVEGMPTFDAFAADMNPYPHSDAFRRRDGSGDMLTAPEYFGLMSALPERTSSGVVTAEDAAAVREWRESNPIAAAKYPARLLLAMIRSDVSSRSAHRYLSAVEPEVAGTYRITFTLAGGPPRTIYMRTHPNPPAWWYRRKPTMAPEPWLQEMPRPDGYSMIVSGARSLEMLPSVCTGVGSSSSAYVNVADPVPAEGKSASEWEASIEPQLLARQFPFDTALQGFTREWLREFSQRGEDAPTLTPARFWRTADGALRVEQADTLRDGRVLSLAGERISERTILCWPRNAQDSATMAAEVAAHARVIDTVVYVGRVIDEKTGSPVASAVVYPSAFRATLTATTDAAGYFRLALPAIREHRRNYLVTASARGLYQERRAISISAGQCVMPACPADHPDTMNFRMRHAPPWSTLEVCSGKECASVPRGSQPTGVEGGTTIDSVVVVGRVTDDRSGLPLPGTSVEFRSGRIARSANADSLGYYRLALPTATDSVRTYIIEASWPGYSRDGREIAVPPRLCERAGCSHRPETLNFYLRAEDAIR